jgi:hypothetical protein
MATTAWRRMRESNPQRCDPRGLATRLPYRWRILHAQTTGLEPPKSQRTPYRRTTNRRTTRRAALEAGSGGFEPPQAGSEPTMLPVTSAPNDRRYGRSPREPPAGLEPATPVVPGRGPTRRAKASVPGSGSRTRNHGAPGAGIEPAGPASKARSRTPAPYPGRWSGSGVSNPVPAGWKPAALPDELLPRSE